MKKRERMQIIDDQIKEMKFKRLQDYQEKEVEGVLMKAEIEKNLEEDKKKEEEIKKNQKFQMEEFVKANEALQQKKKEKIEKEKEEDRKIDWIPNKINQKKMGTNSSVEYNIITPMYKGSNRFITATELNKDNFYNENPSFRRIKSISEFIDLTRVSATNTLQCFNRKNKIPNFKFKNMVATDQADEFYTNRNLIEKSI